jgi:hypothetical protein
MVTSRIWPEYRNFVVAHPEFPDTIQHNPSKATEQMLAHAGTLDDSTILSKRLMFATHARQAGVHVTLDEMIALIGYDDHSIYEILRWHNYDSDQTRQEDVYHILNKIPHVWGKKYALHLIGETYKQHEIVYVDNQK